MASSYLPVETILKVSDKEIFIQDKNDEHLTVTSSGVSIGTQYDWKVNESIDLSKDSLSDNEKTEPFTSTSEMQITTEKSHEAHTIIKNWAMESESDMLPNQNILIPSVLSPQFACNLPNMPTDEKFLLQFDYKRRNQFKTQQRRLDPSYRSQERVRQRTVMRLKRQDPGFRAAEREKGRFRMRLKRLDPEFRTQERERQRERMKMKRSDPEFREKEREQQKTRLYVKRLDPAFKEKERALDCLRMRTKRQTAHHYPTSPTRTYPSNENESTDKLIFTKNCKTFQQALNAKLSRESMMEAFHFQKQQHRFNFNFYNSDKEQWSHDLCTRTLNQEILPDIPSPELAKESSPILKTEDVTDSSDTVLNMKSSETPDLEVVQKT